MRSVLQQSLTAAEFEIIVVNDSRRPLPPADWHDAGRLRIIETHGRERSVARNTGAAIARGKYLHFLDDDDWMLPEAFSDFWRLAQHSDAVWLYGGYHFVGAHERITESWQPDEEGNCLVRLAAAEWLPLQASLIRRSAFFDAGGFEPNMIPFQDNDLARQVLLRGPAACTGTLVASIVRDEKASTTDYGNLRRNVRRSNEKLLGTPGAFQRLRGSAVTRPVDPAYWQGRITSLYLNATVWNLQHRRIFVALSRLLHALWNCAASGTALLAPSYWRGALRPHTTRGFLCSTGVVDWRRADQARSNVPSQKADTIP